MILASVAAEVVGVVAREDLAQTRADLKDKEEIKPWYALVTTTFLLALAVHMNTTTRGSATMSTTAPNALLLQGTRLVTRRGSALLLPLPL